jgi:hypothetical protein
MLDQRPAGRLVHPEALPLRFQRQRRAVGGVDHRVADCDPLPGRWRQRHLVAG